MTDKPTNQYEPKKGVKPYQLVNMIRQMDKKKAGLSALDVCVLVMLASRADDKRTCYPSLSTIADDTGANRRSVIRSIKTLAKKKLIGKFTANRKSTTYVIQIAYIDEYLRESASDRESPVGNLNRCHRVTSASDRESPKETNGRNQFNKEDNKNKYDVPTVPASRGTYVEVDDYDEEPF